MEQPQVTPVDMPHSIKNMLFSEQSIRSRFVTKVFILVTVVLGIVSFMCAVPFIFPAFMVWTQKNIAFLFVAIIYFVVASVLLCCSSVCRSYPLNLIALGIITLATGYMVMATASTFNAPTVLLALCMTTCSSTAIIVFAVFVKKNLT
ncbi:hypothetical protein GCK32_017363, partial [Trichostrongylus colubriformis]